MSIALENGNTTNHGIDRSGYVHGLSFIAIYNSPGSARFAAGDGLDGVPANFAALESVARDGENDDSCGKSSSSSIGRNSDDDLSDGGDGEVQSEFKCGPLKDMDALEEVLPIRRSISQFYHGKSKSFASLADAASCSSLKGIVKPENAYTRKRKNLLAYNNFWDKNHNSPLRSYNGGISKRFACSSRNTSALPVVMNGGEVNIYVEKPHLKPSSSNPRLPPLPPQARRSSNNELSPSPPRQKFSSSRSFSLSDLHFAAPAAPSISASVLNNENNVV